MELGGGISQAKRTLTVACSAVLAACGGGSGGGDTFQPEIPSGTDNSPPSISGNAPTATEDKAYYFAPSISDEDGDEVTVNVSGLPNWLQYSAVDYAISGTPSADDLGRSAQITYTADDGQDSSQHAFTIQVDYVPLKQALRTGDHRYVDQAGDFLDNAQQEISQTAVAARAIHAELFNLDSNNQPKLDGSSITALSWTPTHDAAHLVASYGQNHDVLISNATSDPDYDVHQYTLGIAGDQAGEQGNAKFLALGGHPLRNHQRDSSLLNEQMHGFMENVVKWLAGRDNFAERQLKVVITQMDQSYYFPDQGATRNWLNERFPGQVQYNGQEACDGTLLPSCLTTDVDLVMISQISKDSDHDAITVDAIEAWLAAGKSVLYLHHNGNLTALGESLFETLDISYLRDNYWWRLALDNYDSRSIEEGVPVQIKQIADFLQRLEDESFTVDFSGCSNHSCPDESGFDEQFLNAAETLQDFFQNFDEKGKAIFDHGEHQFLKSVLLLADKYRQSVSYPMDKTNTPQIEFLKSYFADHILYNRRPINPAQADMGNFSRSDFSHIDTVDQAVSLTSKSYFRATGVYALPGQTVTVTRNDNANVETTVFINTQRSGATHQFDSDAYNRPKYLRSVDMPIQPGETISFTSAYGGPIQIGFDSNGEQVSFQFQNVGQHPFWASSADDQRFDDALNAGDYDWAELATSAFEVHSKLDKMQTTVSDTTSGWNNGSEIANATQRYMSDLPHVLAGFQGEGIDVIPEIHNFAADKGWTIDTLDIVKHMNADQATCGYGCSGNPYDAYWSYSPIGHGDNHELGHGLERHRFRFAGWEGHAVTNPYSYYSKSHYFIDTGIAPNCQSLPFESLKQTLQDSRSQADPFAYMQAADLTAWNQGVAITIQMMMAAQQQGVLENGWHLLARLHILDREFNRADNNDDDWEAKKTSLGFGQFTRSEARALNNNDWLAIALSVVAERDMRNYLHMWGLDVGTEAANQVASLGLTEMPMQFFDSTARGYCETMTPAVIAID